MSLTYEPAVNMREHEPKGIPYFVKNRTPRLGLTKAGRFVVVLFLVLHQHARLAHAIVVAERERVQAVRQFIHSEHSLPRT